AGLDASAPATIRVETDGDIELTLAREDAREVFSLAPCEHRIDAPSAPESATAFAAVVTRNYRWTAIESELPVQYTVRDLDGNVLCETTALRCLVIDRTGSAPAAVTVAASNLIGTSDPAEAEVTRRGR